MYEHDSVVFRQHDVRSPGKVARGQAESQAGSMKIASDGYFRLGITPADTGHHPAPRGLIDNVNHQAARRIPMHRANAGHAASYTSSPNCSNISARIPSSLMHSSGLNDRLPVLISDMLAGGSSG